MSSKLNQAVSYNNSLQSMSRTDWQVAQLLISVDLDPDGKPGKATSSAIMKLQEDHSLFPNGKLTAQVHRILDKREVEAYRSIKRSGVWCDTNASWTSSNSHRLGRMFNDYGIDHVMIQLNHSGDKTFNCGWKNSQLKSFSKTMAQYGVGVGIMPWIIPNSVWIEGFALALPGILRSIHNGPIEISCDVERPWGPAHLSGYSETYEAADRLNDIIINATKDLYPSCIISTTTFADAVRGSNGSRQYCVKTIGSGQSGQFYATTNGTKTKKKDGTYTESNWFHRDGPMRAQHLGIKAFLDLGFEIKDISGGVNAYDNSFNGVPPHIARLYNALAIGSRGVSTVIDWSLKALAYGSSEDDIAKQKLNGKYHTDLKRKRGI